MTNLATALAAFQAEMPTVPKAHTAKVPMKAGGSYSYKYADLADVTEAAMPLLTKHGLSFSACPRPAERGYELVGVLLHSSGERLEGSLPLGGNSPQEIGSSLTYMRRYLLGCLTGLVTDNDDDGTLAQRAATRKPAAKPQAEPEARPEPGLPADKPIQAKTRAAMFALFSERHIADARQLEGINQMLGTAYTSRGDLTEDHGREVVKALRAMPPPPEPAEAGESA